MDGIIPVLSAGMRHDIATTDYVARISRCYRDFFAGRTAREIGSYNCQFDAAVLRLGVIRRVEGVRGYYIPYPQFPLAIRRPGPIDSGERRRVGTTFGKIDRF